MKITRVQLKLLQKRAQLHNLNSDNFIGCDLSNEMFTMTFAVAEERKYRICQLFFTSIGIRKFIYQNHIHTGMRKLRCKEWRCRS